MASVSFVPAALAFLAATGAGSAGCTCHSRVLSRGLVGVEESTPSVDAPARAPGALLLSTNNPKGSI